MADVKELKARLEFRRAALEKLREAYIALVDGRVKSYTIENRQLTRLDLSTLKRQIATMEDEVDDLETAIEGSRPRRAFGVVPMDW